MRKLTIHEVLKMGYSTKKRTPDDSQTELFRKKEYPRLDKIILPLPVKKVQSVLDQLSILVADINSDINYTHKAYSFEIYFLSIKTELPNGVDHYNQRRHFLELLKKEKIYLQKYFHLSKKMPDMIMLLTLFTSETITHSIYNNKWIMKQLKPLSKHFVNQRESGISVTPLTFISDKCTQLLQIDEFHEKILETFTLVIN